MNSTDVEQLMWIIHDFDDIGWKTLCTKTIITKDTRKLREMLVNGDISNYILNNIEESNIPHIDLDFCCRYHSALKCVNELKEKYKNIQNMEKSKHISKKQ